MAAASLEPQSVMVQGSHGTHVASIAAGNLGVARNAHLAGVLVALRPEDTLVSSSFYDSTRIAHAVDYLIALAAELGGAADRYRSRSTSASGPTATRTTRRARWPAGSTTRSRRRGGA